MSHDYHIETNDFFRSSYGLVFFGVPNLGLKQGRLRDITSARRQLNAQLIADLEVDSHSEPGSYLRTLQNNFIRCCKKQSPPFEIVAYYEKKTTPTLRTVSLYPFSRRPWQETRKILANDIHA